MAVNRSGPVESFVILETPGHSASIISAVKIKDDRFAAPDDPGCGFGISILTPAR
jgi:hypothetical protein